MDKVLAAPGAARAAAIGAPLVLLLALLTALDAMAIDLYLPGMPAIAQAFGVPAGRVQQTLSVFLAGLAVGQAFYGPLLDCYGRRPPLLAGIAVFVAGSVLAALATSIEMLLAARFLQALGASAGLVTPRAIVADLCGVAESTRIFSLLMQVMMIAPIFAPMLGGVLLEHAGWRASFWAMAVLGVAGLAWSLRALPESLPARQRVPLGGRAILRSYAAQLARPAFMLYTMAGGVVMGALFSYISGAAFVLTGTFALTPMQFSYVFALNAVGLVAGGQLVGMLLRRGVREQRIMQGGLLLHGAAGGVLGGLAWIGAVSFVPYAVLLGVSIGALGLVFGPLTALTMAKAGGQAGVASAVMGSLHYLLAALIGYAASAGGRGAASLPLVLCACGVVAVVLCLIAERASQAPLDRTAPTR